MAKEAYNAANDLFVDEKYEDALKLYTQAIELDSGVTDFFVKRSACHIKLQNYTEAIDDANSAIKIDSSNSTAYLRKGIAAFNLDEFETAQSAFEKGLSLGKDEATFKTWIRKCAAEIGSEESSTPTPATTSSSTPSADADLPPPLEEDDSKMKIDEPEKPVQTPTIITNPVITGPIGNFTIPKPESKVRHSWYQTDTHVTVEFFVKDLKDSDCEVEFNDESIEVAIKLGDSTEWVYDKVLHGKIIPKECTKRILAMKLVLQLKKDEAKSWKSLEKMGNPEDVNAKSTPDNVKHLYPSSKGAKNWDKIAAEIPDDKVEGEQALNKVFQQIYSGGSEEQRKAMIKSFTESGGTVLSTNWDEVGKDKVKGSPPKGMEMHEWDELNRGK